MLFVKEKNFFLLLGVFVFLFSCTNKKTDQTIDVSMTDVNDSTEIVMDSTVIDSIEEDCELIVDTIYVYEFFDDFIFNYASDGKLRMKRTVFPLPYYKEDVSLKIEKSEWEIDSLFFASEYYTLLIDQDDEIEIQDSVAQSSIQVEWYYREPFEAVKYYFEKINGRWMLEGVNSRPIVEGMNKNFIEFFFRFSNDSIFQSDHVRQPLIFVTTDPDDDFEILETFLDINQWHAFKPVLPADVFSNINYGQHNDDKSSHKIVQLKGIGNGFLNTLYFTRRNDSWELYKFEDTSN